MACSRCEREVAGAAVLCAADLDDRSHAVICGECVRTAPAAALTSANGHEPTQAQPTALAEGVDGLAEALADSTEAAASRSGALERRLDAGLRETAGGLTRLEEQPNDRLDRLAERTALVAQSAETAQRTVHAAARASAPASAVGPLRADLRALREEVAAQTEAMAARRKRPAPRPRSVPGKTTTASRPARTPKA